VLESSLDLFSNPLEILSPEVAAQMTISVASLFSSEFRELDFIGPQTLQQWISPQNEALSRNSLEWILKDNTLQELENLPTPNVIVGYQDDWVEMSPASLYFWEKCRLGAYSPKKHVSYYVVTPKTEYLLPTVQSFFKELTCVYEVRDFIGQTDS
jgi:hypothetical protein